MWLEDIKLLARNDPDWQAGLTEQQILAALNWFATFMAQSFVLGLAGLKLYFKSFPPPEPPA